MMENKLPEGVLLEMAEANPVDGCLGCYFILAKEKCPREPDKHNFNRLSCINDRDVIFQELEHERE